MAEALPTLGQLNAGREEEEGGVAIGDPIATAG